MRWLLSFVLLILVACSSAPTFEGIDWAVWKEDRDACANQRAQYAGPLKQQLDYLKGLSEMEIANLMGKPDQTELYKRNQKFYYYFITPSAACAAHDSTAQRLILRFNAIGLAKEVSIE